MGTEAGASVGLDNYESGKTDSQRHKLGAHRRGNACLWARPWGVRKSFSGKGVTICAKSQETAVGSEVLITLPGEAPKLQRGQAHYRCQEVRGRIQSELL